MYAKKGNTEKGVLSGMVNSIGTPSEAGSADGLALAEKTVLSDVEALSSLSALSSDMVAAIYPVLYCQCYLISLRLTHET